MMSAKMRIKQKENVMFGRKKYLCSSCKTGKESFELDRHSEMCPYISFYNCKKKKCNYYIPLVKDKKTFASKILGAFNLFRK